MKVIINSVHFDADKKLIDFINKKVKKLIQYTDDIVSADVFLRLENSQEPDNKTTEIKLYLPGNELFAKKQCKTFEEATDTAVEALKRQVDKHKDRLKK